MDKENWVDIVGYEGLYQVSDLGRVARHNRIRSNGRFYEGVICKLQVNHRGYQRITLCGNNFSVARLVGVAFVPNPENKPEINHKFGNKLDNRATELEWSTRSENMQHAY